MGTDRLTQEEIEAIRKNIGAEDIEFLSNILPQLNADQPVEAKPKPSRFKRMWRCLFVSSCCNSNC